MDTTEANLPLPAKHALSFYNVLGTLKGLYMLLGSPADEAEQRAVEALQKCKPDRRRSPHLIPHNPEQE